jgi:cell division protein FtsN
MIISMKDKGHVARIERPTALYHVRVGSFASRAEAVRLVSRLKLERIDAIVVEATRREP